MFQFQEIQRSLDLYGLPLGPEDTFQHHNQKTLLGVHIILIDDDPDVRRLFARVLTRAGASVFSAESAQNARVLFSAVTFDAIISDIGLPDEDGISLLKSIRTADSITNKKIPAIAVTRFSDRESQTKDAGFQLYLRKPISPRALIAAVASVLDVKSQRVD